jgi:hypothetical protein
MKTVKKMNDEQLIHWMEKTEATIKKAESRERKRLLSVRFLRLSTELKSRRLWSGYCRSQNLRTYHTPKTLLG